MPETPRLEDLFARAETAFCTWRVATLICWAVSVMST